MSIKSVNKRIYQSINVASSSMPSTSLVSMSMTPYDFVVLSSPALSFTELVGVSCKSKVSVTLTEDSMLNLELQVGGAPAKLSKLVSSHANITNS